MPQSSNPYCFDSLVTYKLVDIIANENMEPNVITVINIIPSILSLYYLYKDEYILFFIFLIIRLFLDCLDGHVARKYNKTTDFGADLDHYTDMIFFILLIILLTYRLNIIILIFFTCILTIILNRIYLPVITEFFQFVEDNTVLMVPLISILFIYLQNI